MQDAINANAQARIEEAKTEAAKANEGLGKANAEIARLTTVTAQANKQTKEISLRIEEEAGKRIEAERRLLELQERLQPRYLNAQQEMQLIDALKNASFKGDVRINSVLGDAEGNAFARQIDNILKKAGWNTSGVDQSVFDRNPRGVFILIRSAQDVPKHTSVLVDVFRIVGISVDGGINEKLEPNRVEIRVGNKP